jgi:hypothetical protein
MVYCVRAYGESARMSELDILYMTVSALAKQNKDMQQKLYDFIARTPPRVIMPDQTTMDFTRIKPRDKIEIVSSHLS